MRSTSLGVYIIALTSVLLLGLKINGCSIFLPSCLLYFALDFVFFKFSIQHNTYLLFVKYLAGPTVPIEPCVWRFNLLVGFIQLVWPNKNASGEKHLLALAVAGEVGDLVAFAVKAE